MNYKRRDLEVTTLDSMGMILDSFKFESVHALMVLNKWTWCNLDVIPRVPTVEELKAQARQLFYQMAKQPRENTRVGCGGLLLHRWVWDTSIELELIFVWQIASTTSTKLVEVEDDSKLYAPGTHITTSKHQTFVVVEDLGDGVVRARSDEDAELYDVPKSTITHSM